MLVPNPWFPYVVRCEGHEEVEHRLGSQMFRPEALTCILSIRISMSWPSLGHKLVVRMPHRSSLDKGLWV
jgi:hypothetical protein